jgi:hypothetical protein
MVTSYEPAAKAKAHEDSISYLQEAPILNIETSNKRLRYITQRQADLSPR